MEMTQGVRLSGIVKTYGANTVLDGVSLDVRPGEFLSLVGASGCGKSTLLRIIAGLEDADAGAVSIDGRDVTGLDPQKRDVAMVFQSYALYPHMSAGQNIATPLRMSRLSPMQRLPLVGGLVPGRRAALEAIRDDVGGVAAQLRIEQLLDRKPSQLSGGQRQRVALARAMVRQPAAFLMDEPLSNLDAKLRVHMRDELTELHRRLRATFIYVTHDQVEAMTMSDRIALMAGGTVLQLGTPSELYQRPVSLQVAQFIGSPAINCLPVDASGAQIRLFGETLPLVAGTRTPATLAIRPEALRLDARPGDVALAARVKRIEHHGADCFVSVTLDKAPDLLLHARVAPAQAVNLAADHGIDLHFALEAVHLFDHHGLRLDVVTSLNAGPARLRAKVPA